MAAGGSSAGSLEHRTLLFISSQEHGASLPEVEAAVPGFRGREHVAQVLNELTSGGAATMLRGGRGSSELRWKAAGAREQRARGLGAEELLVYQHIQKAATSGVWTKDLKVRTNLPQAQITRILKALEAKLLIKSIKSVANPSRKLVMLFELEPSKEVTGGAWYNASQKFDGEFINVLRSALLKYLERNGTARLAAVTSWLVNSGLVKNVSLGEDDVQQVLDSLQFEGKVDVLEGDGEDLYRIAAEAFPPTTALTSLPCGRCPVIDQCRDGGPISPEACVYFQQWLGM